MILNMIACLQKLYQALVCGRTRLSLCITCLLVCHPIAIQALDVYYFSVQGLRLNMQLDEVIKTFKVNHVKSSKDKYGLVNGYEIVQRKGEMTLALNFTGEKRLYRIDFTNQYPSYRNNSVGIFELLKQKYGDPTYETIETENSESRDIRACWGRTCNRFRPSTPALKSIIDYDTGRLKLTLVDNRIFNTDWKKYKEAYNSARYGNPSTESESSQTPTF